MDDRDDRDEQEQPRRTPRPANEGVRIIGAEEAAAALEKGEAAGRRPGDAPRFGDVPPQPAGPRPAHRFPLPDSVEPASAVPRPPVAPSGGRGDRPRDVPPAREGEPTLFAPAPPPSDAFDEDSTIETEMPPREALESPVAAPAASGEPNRYQRPTAPVSDDGAASAEPSAAPAPP